MIRGYKQKDVVDTFGDNCLIYEATKDNKQYYMYEFEQFGDADSYNFKVLAKIFSSHILGVVEEFQEASTKYIITDYAETDLLKLQTSQPSSICPLPIALDFFSKLIMGLEELHESKLVYRNIRPQTIKVRDNDIYFYDFTMSQFVRRKERMFDPVGSQNFLAPQFFSQDGYSYQVDIWAAGVTLYFMLLHQYPFTFSERNEKVFLEQFKKKCGNGFSFQKSLEKCKNPGYLKSNSTLEDFFFRIFDLDYTQRITIKQIKKHKLFEGYFPQKMDRQMLEAIGEEEGSSLLMTRFIDLKKFKLSYQIEKEQVILDFAQKCSQSLMLDCAENIPQLARERVKFAILKMAMIKVNNLVDMFYGKRKPDFEVSEEEWDTVRYTTGFKKVQMDIEKKQRVLKMLFKSAVMQLPEKDEEFFNEQIPQDFNDIKIPYRTTLGSMFQIGKDVMIKNKTNKCLIRKITQVLARMVIMHLVNRIFEQEDVDKNFEYYFKWNNNDKNLENLDAWIHQERQINLKKFIKEATKSYLI